MDYRPSIIPMDDLESAARAGSELAEQERNTTEVTTSAALTSWWPIIIGLVLN